jgi:hypothetical protein
MPVVDMFVDQQWLSSGGWGSASWKYPFPQPLNGVAVVTLDGFNESSSGSSAVRCAITAYRYLQGGTALQPALPGITDWKHARRVIAGSNIISVTWAAQVYDCKEALVKFEFFVFA